MVKLLASRYLLHGLWDMLHGAALPDVTPEWNATLCVGYGITVAACVQLRYRSTSELAVAQ